MAEVVDKAILDDSDYLKSLKRMQQGVDGFYRSTDGRLRDVKGKFVATGKAGEQAFLGIGKSSSASGAQIGVISGVVGALTNKFIEMGQRAIGALVNVGKESVDLAANLEVIGKVFTGIFQGNKDAAMAALGEIRKESRALGVDLTETAANFAPFVSSVEQIKRLGSIGAALGLAQPEQVASGGVRIALQEALSGNALSLVRRFEIPKAFGKKLQEALDEGGIDAFLTKFEEILKLLGRDLETLGGGLQQAQGRAQVAGQQIQEAFGNPVVKELTEQFDTLAQTVNDNFDDIELVADTFGRVAANVADIIGGGLNDFLAGLDSEQLTRIAEKFFDISEDSRLLIETMAGANFPESFITGVETFANKLDEALITATQLNLLSAAGAAKAEAEYKAWADEMERLHGEGTIATGVLKEVAGIPGVVQASNALAEYVGDEEAAALATKSLAAGQEAYNKVLTDGVSAIEESKQAKEDNRQATDDLAASQKENTSASLDEADAFLQQREAAEALAEAKDAAVDAQAKVDEARAKAEQDFQNDLLEADIKFERARTDALLDGQRKRLDAAKKNLQAIQDIEKKHKQAVADSELDLDRDIEDLNTKFSREKIEQRKEEAQAIIDLEVDTGRKIADILKQSSIDLDEAAEKRDAVGYLRILKQRNLDIVTAQKDASRQVEDIKLAGQRKREELKIQQQQELDDARLANARRLEDLQTSLDRELEAQATAFAREQEQIATNEQRKIDDLVTARERDREDAKRHYEEKLADLEISLAAELETIKKYNALLEEEAAKHAAAMAEAEDKKPSKTGGKAAGFGENPGTIGQGKDKKPPSYKAGSSAGFGSNPGTITGHAYGGLVNRGQAEVVGELGPELFTPSSNGKIIPTNQLLMPSFTPKSAISNITNSQQSNVNLGVLDPDSVGVINEARMRNIVLSILAGL